MDALIDVLRELPELPSPPVVLTKLLDALRDDNVGTAEVGRIVSMDRALAMTVLRQANSVAGGSSQEVASLQDAVTRLGASKVLEIALALESRALFAGGAEGYGVEGAQAWRGALAGALAAEDIARTSGACEPELAFTAALLRDAGKLALDAMFGVDRVQAAFSSEATSRGQLAREEDAFGFDHAEVGGALGELWGLPERLVAAIRHHHDPPSDDTDGLCDVVHCSDVVVNHLGLGTGDDGLRYDIHGDAAKRLGIDWQVLSNCLVSVMDDLRACEKDLLEEGSPEVSE